MSRHQLTTDLSSFDYLHTFDLYVVLVYYDVVVDAAVVVVVAADDGAVVVAVDDVSVKYPNLNQMLTLLPNYRVRPQHILRRDYQLMVLINALILYLNYSDGCCHFPLRIRV